MASLSTDSTGTKRIQFVDGNGKRKAIRLPKTPMRVAEAVKLRVEALLASKLSRSAIDRDTAQWLADVDDALHEKLVRVGLIAPRAASADVVTVAGFLSDYLDKRCDVKGGTMTFYRHTERNLVECFGDKPVADVTPGDAEDFKLFLIRSGLATPTVIRRCSLAKSFFRAAIRRRLIDRNPFDEFKGTVRGNREKFRFVTREETQKLIDSAPCGDWRLLIALARFGGLRTPSESLSLRWEDINWEHNRMTVRSPKTEHHEGKATRLVPLFPELRPFLEEAFDRAEPGETHVITRYREADYKGPTGWKGCNLGTQFLRIIRDAGLKPWPKPWHNLRATRQTELSAVFPVHVVCEWLGNGKLIAQEHYLRTTDADFTRAATEATGNCAAAHQTAQSSSEMGGDGRMPVRPAHEKTPVLQGFSGHRDKLRNCGVGDTGFEPVTSTV